MWKTNNAFAACLLFYLFIIFCCCCCKQGRNYISVNISPPPSASTLWWQKSILNSFLLEAIKQSNISNVYNCFMIKWPPSKLRNFFGVTLIALLTKTIELNWTRNSSWGKGIFVCYLTYIGTKLCQILFNQVNVFTLEMSLIYQWLWNVQNIIT